MAGKGRTALTAVWVLLAILYVGPLAPVIQNIDGGIGGVSLFVIWAVFLGPLAMIALYGINSYFRIQEDQEPTGNVARGAGE